MIHVATQVLATIPEVLVATLAVVYLSAVVQWEHGHFFGKKSMLRDMLCRLALGIFAVDFYRAEIQLAGRSHIDGFAGPSFFGGDASGCSFAVCTVTFVVCTT